MYVEMERGLFRFIMRHSQRDQFFLVLLSILSLPILYATLELPKTIINQAIDGHGGFPKTVLGADFAQIPYLMLLCGSFLGLVLITGAFKYFTSTYRYRIGDALLRRLRYELIERVMRFPLMELRNTSSAPIVSMVTAETSSLGFFMAEAFAVPAVAAGTLATISLFMFLQNWMMGVAAIALYPAQIYLIPKIQKKVNALQRDEVVAVRHISERIGEVVAAVQEIHGHDTSQYELKDFSRRLDGVFDLRVQIGSKRYMANVLNAFFFATHAVLLPLHRRLSCHCRPVELRGAGRGFGCLQRYVCALERLDRLLSKSRERAGKVRPDHRILRSDWSDGS